MAGQWSYRYASWNEWAVALTVSLIAVPIFAQTGGATHSTTTAPATGKTDNTANTTPSDRNSVMTDNGEAHASKVIGYSVYNDHDKKVGSVDDLLIGKDGKMNAVLSVGGFLGMGTKYVQVPYSNLTFGNTQKDSGRKLHIAVDVDTGRIAAAAVTTHDVHDASQVGPLLDQVNGPVASFTADGAYDQDGVYGQVAARHPEASVIVPPRSSAVPSDTAQTAPTMRDLHLQSIAERGRMAWQKAAGYNWRALVEADISRFKRVIGDGLRSRTDRRRAAEVAIAVNALNQMLELGRPKYVRIP